MALENLVGADKYLSALVPANPVGADDKREGDDHVRGIKNTLKNTFPNLTGAVTATHGELSSVTAKVAKAGDSMTGRLTLATGADGGALIVGSADPNGTYAAWTTSAANRGFVGTGPLLFGAGSLADFGIRSEASLTLAAGGAVPRVIVGATGAVAVIAPTGAVDTLSAMANGANYALKLSSDGLAGSYCIQQFHGSLCDGFAGVGNAAVGNVALRDSMCIGTQTGHRLVFMTTNVERVVVLPAGGVLVRNTTTPAVPVDGGVLWVEGGALKYRGSSGTVTVLAPA